MDDSAFNQELASISEFLDRLWVQAAVQLAKAGNTDAKRSAILIRSLWASSYFLYYFCLNAYSVMTTSLHIQAS